MLKIKKNIIYQESETYLSLFYLHIEWKNGLI